MAWLAGDTETRQQLEELFDFSDFTLPQTASVYNAVLADETLRIDPSFAGNLQTIGADLHFEDFIGNVPAVVKHINDLVNQHTDGMIPELVNEQDVAGNVLAFLNTLLLKANWETRFDPKETAIMPFGKNSTPVNMMSAKQTMLYCNHPQATIFKKALQGGASVIMLVPDEQHMSIEGIIANLDTICADLQWEEMKMTFGMPKLNMESTLQLGQYFPVLGSQLTFPGAGLDKNEVKTLQKAKLILNEEGVEAAAATIMLSRSIEADPEFFIQDEFVLLIEENGEVLFACSVVNPAA